MHNYKTIFAGIIFFVFSSASPFAAAENAPSFSAKVHVLVRGDANITGQAESYIKRELRSLSDVVLVDEGAEWVLDIIVMELKTQGGYKSGILLSGVILSKYSNVLLSLILPEQAKEESAILTNYLYWYPDHWVNVANGNSLRTLCVELVANFDNKMLEESRKQYRKIMQNVEKKKP